MKKVIFLVGILMMAGSLSGCAIPVAVSDGVHRRAFVPCAKDELCFRETYGIARDGGCSDFPVAYRNNDSEFIAKSYNWFYRTP